MILGDITEKSTQGPSQDFKRPENGFPRAYKLSSSQSRFKRSCADKIQQDLFVGLENKQSTQAQKAQKTPDPQQIQARKESIQHKDESDRTVRFSLSGELSNGDLDREEKSLQELLDYTRSSSAQIRRRAWGIILKIFKKSLKENGMIQVENEIEKVDLGLYLRVGLDQKEVDEVLEVLEIFMDLGEGFDEFQGLSRNLMVKIGISEQLLDQNIRKSNGFSCKKSLQVNEKTFGEIKRLMKHEPILGLIEGDILERLKYLLSVDMEIWNIKKILKIINGFSKHSRKSCTAIVQKGILEDLLKYSRIEETRLTAFQIFLNVIGSSRENAQQFIRINGLDVIMGSIADLQDEDTYLCWMILSFCSRYGLTGGVLSDYRPLFYAKAREYFAFSNDEFHLKSRIGLLKCLKDFVCIVPKGFIMGGLNDEMKPFLDILLSTLSWIIDVKKFQENVMLLHLASISSALDFFTAYLTRLESSASTSDLCQKIFHYVQLIYTLLKEKALEFAYVPIAYVDETPPKFWQKMPSNLSEMIGRLNHQTFGIDFFNSILDFTVVVNPWIYVSLDMKSDIQNLANYIMEQPCTYWTRFYAQAQTFLLLSYLKLLENDLDEKKRIKTYLYLLSSFQPGQEILCSRTLFALFKLLDTSPLNHISTISNEHKMLMMDIFDKNFYSDASLKNSSAIHNSEYESIKSLWMEIEEVEPTLPLSKFWAFSPIDSFLDEEQNQIMICEEDLSGYIFVIYSLASLYDFCGLGLDAGRLIIATMKVCLLNSLSDEAVCLEPKLQKCIDYALNFWNSTDPINLEPLMGSEINFYQLYSQLLSSFSSSSFGNDLWGRLLLIPLHNMYPCDYKSLFFTSLEPKILGLITAPLERDSKDYIISKLDHEKLKIYEKLIAPKWIKKDRNPFLYNMLTAEHQ